MLKRIKEELYKFKSQLDKNQRAVDDSMALTAILKLFPEGTFLPFSTFSINPYTLLHILNEIKINQSTCIVEFGSGLSSIVIAKFLQLYSPDTKLLSIDNNADWSDYVKKEANLYNTSGNLHFYASKIITNKELQDAQWYDFQKINQQLTQLDTKIDLVIVDGPSAAISYDIRKHALPAIQPFLDANFTIFIDDIKRKGEHELINQWQHVLGAQLDIIKVYATLKNGERFSSRPISH